MDSITLTKHHGLGNDFLVTFETVADPAAFARFVCDRKRGIGADGLILGTADDDGETDQRMTLFNADGSRAEISGNGIRCFAQAIVARSGTTDDLRIGTDAGVRLIEIERTEDPATLMVSVDMGEASELPEPAGWATLECHPDRPVTHLSLGNPHSVVGVDDVDLVDLADLGGRVPHVNLEIVAPTERPDVIRMRVHERGVGITEACGSGAVASASAAASWGLATPVDGKLTVEMDGGRASVAIDQPTPGHVTLIGPTTVVGTVEVPRAAHR